MIEGSVLHGTVSSAAVIILLLVGWAWVKRGDDCWNHCAWKSKQCSSDHITVSCLGGCEEGRCLRKTLCNEQ